MSMWKWAALGAVAMIVAGAKLLGAYAAFPADPAAAASTGYLVARYKAAPSETAGLIRRHTAACLDERIGKDASDDLKGFFGELMLYTVRNVDRDRRAFVNGYRALAERDGPAIDGRIAVLPEAERTRVAALVEDFADGPHAMAGCLARRLKLQLEFASQKAPIIP